MKKLKYILLAALLLLLTGCQLAQPEIQTSGDMLAGVFITAEPLDFFDMEAYLSDNLRFSGGEIVVDGDTSQYQGRIYGTLEPVTTYDENGNEYHMPDLVFEGLEGIQFVSAQLEDENGLYQRTFSSEGLLHANCHYTSTDEEDQVELSGEIWLNHDQHMTAYFNPVYVDGNGSFYITSGHGFSTSGDNAPGSLYAQTMEDSRTVTENGERIVRSISVKISLGTMYAPWEYVLLQMDEENQVIRQDSYLPGQLPEAVTPEAETAYLLLETHNAPAAGEQQLTREIIGRDAEQFTTRFATENGFISEMSTVIHWK